MENEREYYAGDARFPEKEQNGNRSFEDQSPVYGQYFRKKMRAREYRKM